MSMTRVINPNPKLKLIALAPAVAVLLSACVTTPAPVPTPPPAPAPKPVVVKPTPPPPPPKPAVDEGTLRVLAGVEELQKEITRLRSEVEQQGFEIEQLASRNRELYDDLDNRMRNQENAIDQARNEIADLGSRPAPAPVAMPAPQPVPVPQPAPQPLPTSQPNQTAAVTQPALVPQAVVPTPAPQPGVVPQPAQPAIGADGTVVIGSTIGSSGQPVTAPITQPSLGTAPAPGTDTTASIAVAPQVPASPEATDAYDVAFELLKQGRYNEASDSFGQFMRVHGNTDLADDAQYWIAESNYFSRQFEGALQGYESLMARYPTSDKVPNAMLKKGYIQYEIGAYAEARNQLNLVITRYPGSSVATSAAKRIAKMDADGV